MNKLTELRLIKFTLLAAVVILSFSASNLKAQSFTLQQAVDYALKNNLNIQNSEADSKIAEAKKNETRGIGLPQISGNFDAKEFWEIPTSVLPDFISPLLAQAMGLPPQPPSYIYAKFGVRYNISAGLTATQLLFNSDYLIGLQAAKTYTELAKKNITRSRIETISAVTKAYYLNMQNKYNIQLFDVNLERLKQLTDQMEAMNKEGFIESTELDRMTLLYNNLQTDREKVVRSMSFSQALLKFQMGYDPSKPIVIADSLDLNSISNLTPADPGKINASARIEYQTIENSIKLSELDLKRNKLGFLPTLALYSTLSANNLQNKFSDISLNNRWYPTGIIGITLNQNLFDGFQRHFRTQQVELNLLKSKNGLKQFEQAVSMDVQSASVMMNNAIASLNNQKNNIDLAQKIYKASKLKFEQGLISNLDLYTNFVALKEAQVNYGNAVFEYLNAKVDYDKATGSIK